MENKSTFKDATGEIYTVGIRDGKVCIVSDSQNMLEFYADDANKFVAMISKAAW